VVLLLVGRDDRVALRGRLAAQRLHDQLLVGAGAVHRVAQRGHRAGRRVAAAQRVGALALGPGQVVVDVLVHVAAREERLVGAAHRRDLEAAAAERGEQALLWFPALDGGAQHALPS
jgi:hypothetical protein